MAVLLSLVGFGEAGQAFASAAGWKRSARVFDVRNDAEMRAACTGTGIVSCASDAEALAGSGAVLSLVTADQALIAAQSAARHIAAGALFLDMNSVAPETKREAAQAIEAAGGRYVDVAIMSPVNPERLAVPLLLSGPSAKDGSLLLTGLGFSDVRVVGEDVGRASTIKMLRSVMYKGVEALTAECLMACEKAGVTDEVFGSFGNDWSEKADYRLDRMMVHGLRRAAEMAEALKTLEALGVPAPMTRGTVERQRQIGALGVSPVPEGLAAKLERLVAQ